MSKRLAPAPQESSSRRIVWLAPFFSLLLTGLVFVVLGEVFIRMFFPQPVLFPRWKYNPEYGLMPPPNAEMYHAIPGRWEYTYSINSEGYRGPLVDRQAALRSSAVVVLGDSYTMGVGVNDGEEYARVMAGELGDDFSVINLGSGGWGLTHQIRRFHEFGASFEPEVVILQFCENDPFENLVHPVTILSDGQLVHRNTVGRISPFRQFLASSGLLQRSQIYALVRSAYLARSDRTLAAPTAKPDKPPAGPPKRDSFYVQLLGPFVRELVAAGSRVIMISVNDEIKSAPTIYQSVLEMDSQGLLEYADVVPWFDGVEDYASPEGHRWGVLGHRIIGQQLAALILQAAPN